jgi:hypothetical protein
MNAHDTRGVPVWDSGDGFRRENRMRIFYTRLFYFLHFCHAHVGTHPGLRHMVISWPVSNFFFEIP